MRKYLLHQYFIMTLPLLETCECVVVKNIFDVLFTFLSKWNFLFSVFFCLLMLLLLTVFKFIPLILKMADLPICWLCAYSINLPTTFYSFVFRQGYWECSLGWPWTHEISTSAVIADMKHHAWLEKKYILLLEENVNLKRNTLNLASENKQVSFILAY